MKRNEIHTPPMLTFTRSFFLEKVLTKQDTASTDCFSLKIEKDDSGFCIGIGLANSVWNWSMHKEKMSFISFAKVDEGYWLLGVAKLWISWPQIRNLRNLRSIQVFKSFFCYGVRLGTKSIITFRIVYFFCVKQHKVSATNEITG